jgi:hypothetical protein
MGKYVKRDTFCRLRSLVDACFSISNNPTLRQEPSTLGPMVILDLFLVLLLRD